METVLFIDYGNTEALDTSSILPVANILHPHLRENVSWSVSWERYPGCAAGNWSHPEEVGTSVTSPFSGWYSMKRKMYLLHCDRLDSNYVFISVFSVLILLFNPITSSRSHVSYGTLLPGPYQGCPGAQVARQLARMTSRRMK